MTNICRTVTGVVTSLITVFLLGSQIALAYVATEYDTTTDIPIGTLVSFDSQGKVMRSSPVSTTYIGVVTAVNGGKIAVANSGTVRVFVSDITGPIQNGTRIGTSDLAGVATAWREGHQLVGTVVAPIDGSSSGWQTVATKAADGTSRTARVALATVELTQSTNSAQSGTDTFGSALQKVADIIAGRSVALWRIITALIVGLAGILVAFGLLLSAGRGSFMALGRNPLAGTVILRGMWRVVVVSIGVILAGIVLAYLLLRVGP